MKMQTASVESLRPNPWNSNKISDPANEQKLELSMRRFGCYKPIVVREVPGGFEILGGEHRWKAAKRVGLKEVPIANLGKVSDHTAKELGLVDNSRYGDDDSAALSALLRELGTDLADFMPMTAHDIESLIGTGDLSSLDDLDSIGKSELPDLEKPPSAPTFQVLRFKVPVGDVVWVSAMIEQAQKAHGFTKEDALANAGNALVHILGEVRTTR